MAVSDKLAGAKAAAPTKVLPGDLILAGTLPNAGGRGLAPKPFPIDAPGAIHAPRPADWFLLTDSGSACLSLPLMRMALPATYRPLYGITAHLVPETD